MDWPSATSASVLSLLSVLRSSVTAGFNFQMLCARDFAILICGSVESERSISGPDSSRGAPRRRGGVEEETLENLLN